MVSKYVFRYVCTALVFKNDFFRFRGELNLSVIVARPKAHSFRLGPCKAV